MPKPARVKDVIPDEHVVLSSRGGWEGFSFSLHRHPPFGFVDAAFAEHNVTLIVGKVPFRLEQKKDGRKHEGSTLGAM